MNAASLEPITRTDLRRLARIAGEEREDFFGRRPDWSLLYRRRLLCTALTNRCALHYCNGTSGFEQFDVCLFFAAHAEAAFPHRWVSLRDFGLSKFGRSATDGNYSGRRIRITGRSIPGRPSDNPVTLLQTYFRRGRTPTARQLKEGGAVLIDPVRLLGYVAWPTLLA